MLILFIFGLLLGGASVQTEHYALCKDQHFPEQTCSLEKKLCLENNAADSCK